MDIINLSNENTGWVIINIGHPTNGSQYIMNETFRKKRSESIDAFMKDIGGTWEWWKNKYNFRCVKADITISILYYGKG